MNTTGSTTKPHVFQTVESHKLMLAFTAEVAIKVGQPVKLTTTGTVTPLGAADSPHLKIGDSIQDMPAGEEVTIVMRGHIALHSISAGALAVGPVKYSAYSNTEKKPTYVAAADADTTQGHAIEPATGAGELVTVILL